MLIGRHNEKLILSSVLKDNESHFVAVYGRRRVGKTYLIREFFGNRFTFQHTGLAQANMNEQLDAFKSSLKGYGLKENIKINSWYDAFDALKQLIDSSTEQRKVLFIDELSWMDTAKSNLISALEHFWNGWASARHDIILIVCASATSWMLEKVIHNKGGLYNRLTDRIHLTQFSLSECEEYVKNKGLVMTRMQILQFYMIFGGVPFYWTFLKKGMSVAQNIDNILFTQDAPLKDEYKYLYSSIFKKPEVYLEIVKALGTRKSGLTREEIIQVSGILNSGDLTRKLEELESCGFIRSYKSFGKVKKDTLYQLVDFFTLFYFSFLSERPEDGNYWSNQINTPLINTWNGLAFERVCMEHVRQIKQKLGISGILSDICSFRCKSDSQKGLFGSQIDMLIVRKDQVINLCEMKFSNTEYSVTEKFVNDMSRKTSDLVTATGTKCAVYPTLITTIGVVDNQYSSTLQSVITLDDLFN